MAVLTLRLFAHLIDLACVYLATLPTGILAVVIYGAFHSPGDAAAISATAASEGATWFVRGLFVLYYLVYFTFAHWRFGRTLGKWSLGLRLASTSPGGNVSFGRAGARTLGYFVSGHLTLGLGFALAYFRPDQRALHDLLAGTRVLELAPEAADDREEKRRNAAA